VVAGLLAGLPLALAASPVLARVLFGAREWDPLVVSAVTALLTAAALAAMLDPALRAARSDPMQALQHD